MHRDLGDIEACLSEADSHKRALTTVLGMYQDRHIARDVLEDRQDDLMP